MLDAARSRSPRAGGLTRLLLAALAFLPIVTSVTRLASADPPAELACNAQGPQPFLIRGSYVSPPGASGEERRLRKQAHRRAIRYRTERYGSVPGFGEPEWNATPARELAQATRFMGLRVSVNRRIVPALRCVEQEIRATCGEAYRPDYLSGLRTGNTFHNDEVSNHLYGIALDVDPEHNVCCHCVGPAADHPVCKRPSTLGERMAMPPCWVSAFERFGFYWLGHDALEDTMHFEFLGDPARIVRSPAASSRASPASLASPASPASPD